MSINPASVRLAVNNIMHEFDPVGGAGVVQELLAQEYGADVPLGRVVDALVAYRADERALFGA